MPLWLRSKDATAWMNRPQVPRRKTRRGGAISTSRCQILEASLPCCLNPLQNRFHGCIDNLVNLVKGNNSRPVAVNEPPVSLARLPLARLRHGDDDEVGVVYPELTTEARHLLGSLEHSNHDIGLM